MAALAGQASAHTTLETTSPADGSVLETGPTEMVLTFDEDVSVDLAHVDLENASGDPIDGTVVTAGPARNQLGLDLPELEHGAYRVRYDVRDPIDLHDTTGSVVFGVGEAVVASGGQAIETGDPIEAGVRWVGWAGLVVAIGALFVAVWLARSVQNPESRRVIVRRSLRLVRIGAGTALAAQLLALAVDIVDIGGPLLATTGRVLLAGALGWRLGMTIGFTVVLLLGLRWTGPSLEAGDPGTAPLEGVLALVLLALLGTSAVSAHATTGGSAVTGVVLRTLHVGAIGLWAGGLVVILLVVPKHARVARMQVLGAFSPIAVGAVAVTVASGLVLTGREVTSLTALLSTYFGRVLVVKLVLVVGALLVGGHHYWRLRSDRSPRSPSLVLEAVVLMTVLGAGALLATAPPATGARFDGPAAVPPTVRTTAVDDLLVRISLRPDRPGPNSLDVAVLDTRRPPLGVVGQVTVTLDTGAGESIVRRGTPDADGNVIFDAVNIESPGPIAATVVIDRPGAPVAPVAFDWVIEPLPAPQAPTVLSDSPLAPVVDRLAALAVLLGGLHLLARRRRRRHVGPSPVEPLVDENPDHHQRERADVALAGGNHDRSA